MLKMEEGVEISERIIRKGLTKWHFSRNLKEMRMQALGISVSCDPQAEEAGKCKGPEVGGVPSPFEKE